MAIKVTNEAPAGVRAGLKGSYAWLTQDHLDAITGVSNPTWRTMLYGLCFMHTVVQERRKVRVPARACMRALDELQDCAPHQQCLRRPPEFCGSFPPTRV